jgi:pilus assembly protein CpaB
VKVDDEAGLAGLIMPGTLVDVLVVIKPADGPNQDSISKIVLQNIKVLASGKNMDEPEDRRDPTSVKTVSLLVTPEQAEKLTLASTEGRLRLALRNSIDQTALQTPGANKRTLLTGDAALPAPEAAPQKKVEPQPPKQRPRRSAPTLTIVSGKIGPPAATPTPAPLPKPRPSMEVFEGTKKRTVDFP